MRLSYFKISTINKKCFNRFRNLILIIRYIKKPFVIFAFKKYICLDNPNLKGLMKMF